jgi:hypothetical protein
MNFYKTRRFQMKNLLRLMLVIVFVLIFIPSLFAEVKISGDARIRPRYDINDQTESGGTKTYDIYYLYRARLKLKADIDQGWYFKTMLAHKGVAAYTGKFAEGEKIHDGSLEGARRSTVDFMELYFGLRRKQYGVKGGLFTIGSVSNPIFDLHYYPNAMVDIPFAIFSGDGLYGFSGYYNTGMGKLSTIISVDDNLGKTVENADGETVSETQDQYTIYVDYTQKLSNLTFQPMVMKTIADEYNSAPLTVGVNLGFPKMANFNLSGYFGYSKQSVEEAGEYDAWYARGKVVGKAGVGNIIAWYDYAKKMDDDIDTDFWYAWLSYKIMLHKSDKGTVSILPTVRLVNKNIDGENVYKRTKIEITTDITF